MEAVRCFLQAEAETARAGGGLVGVPVCEQLSPRTPGRKCLCEACRPSAGAGMLGRWGSQDKRSKGKDHRSRAK